MDDRDTTEMMTAFAVGTLIGVGAMLLLRPEPEPRSARVLRQLRRTGRTLGKGARRVGGEVADRASAAADMSIDLVETGRKVAAALREEVNEIVADAREELSQAIGDQVEAAGRTMRKRARQPRRR